MKNKSAAQTAKKKQILDDLEESVKWVKMHQEGKVHGRAVVSDKVRSHANDPVVIKKTEEAKAFFKKAGFPKGK